MKPSSSRTQDEEANDFSSKLEQFDVYNGKISEFLDYLKWSRVNQMSITEAHRAGIQHSIEILGGEAKDDSEKLDALRCLTWLVQDYKDGVAEGTISKDEASYIYVNEYMIKTNFVITSKINILEEGIEVKEALLFYVAESLDDMRGNWKNRYNAEGMRLVETFVYSCMYDEGINFNDYYRCNIYNGPSYALKQAKRILESLCQSYVLLQLIVDWALITVEENKMSSSVESVARAGGAVHILASIADMILKSEHEFTEVYHLLCRYPEVFKIFERPDLGSILPYLMLIRSLGKTKFKSEQLVGIINSLVDLLDLNVEEIVYKEIVSILQMLLEYGEAESIKLDISIKIKILAKRLTQLSLKLNFVEEIDKLHHTLIKLCYDN